jgi:hypothetical protein
VDLIVYAATQLVKVQSWDHELRYRNFAVRFLHPQ